MSRVSRATAVSLTAAFTAVVSLAACTSDSPATAPFEHAADATASRTSGVSTIRVTNGNDAGPGSFRAAIESANQSGVTKFVSVDVALDRIVLRTPVTYTGAQSLVIDGNDVTIEAGGVEGSAIVSTGGASLSFARLTVRGASQQGIEVQVPMSARGLVRLELDDVVIRDNGGHGVLLNEQVTPSTEDGVQPDARGSSASLQVRVARSHFVHNGYSVSDRDGLRVNEGGDGHLHFIADAVWAENNAADGIELDERGNGDVIMQVRNGVIRKNGVFDPADLDDGFDIDEYDGGSILGTVRHTTASDNYEEGFDFNENNAGDLRVEFEHVFASGNGEEGIDLEEDDDFAGGGDLVAVVLDAETNDNGGDGGLKIREKGEGSLAADLSMIAAAGNAVAGVAVREDGEGALAFTAERLVSLGNVSFGLDLDERGNGDLNAQVAGTVVSSNGRGLRVRQAPAGSGSLALEDVQSAGNALADQLVGVQLVPVPIAN